MEHFKKINHNKTNKNKNKNKPSNNKTNKNKNKIIKNKPSKSKRKTKTLKNNYYYYVNNAWVTNTYISKDVLYKSLFTILQKKVDNELLFCVKKHLLNKNTNTPNAKRCKTLYTAITNWNNALVENQTYLYIKQMNEFRKHDDNLYPFLKWMIYNGVSTPINLTIVHDIKKPKRYIATINESGLSFVIKEMYFKHDQAYNKTREYFKEFISLLFKLFFGENHCYSADDVFDIELELAKHMYLVSESESYIKTYNKFHIKKPKSACNFDAEQFLKEFGIQNIKQINLSNPEFIKHAFTLMKKEWTTNKWNSYWVFKLLMYVSMFHSTLHKFVFDFFTLKLNNTRQKEKHIDMIATLNITTIMSSTVGETYIKYYKNTDEINYATDLIEKIKKTFKSRITKNAWLSQSTKERALIKLDKLICAIGYRDKWPEDPDCNFAPDDALGNNVKYLHWLYNSYNKQLHKPVPDETFWLNNDEMNVYNVNAFYNNVKNEFILPNAILQKPFVDITKNISYNLAFIGFIIAHEMVHGFDTEGCLFDETGALNYWWTKEDSLHYKRLQNDVVEHYEALAKVDGIKLDGHTTLDENIADISALNIVEDTLESYLIDNNIFGEHQNAYFKDLYYNYARQWRSLVKPRQIRTLMLTDPHSMSKYRVNCVLMRSKRFAQIFDIKHTDGMYYARELNEIW